MSKSFKTVGLLVTAFMLVSTIFAGCGSMGKEKEQQASTAAASAASATEATATIPQGPMEVTYCANVAPNTDDAWSIEYYEQTFGVKLIPVRLDDKTYMDQLNIKLASGEVPDVMVINGFPSYSSVIGKGVVAELAEELIQKNMPRYYELAKGMDPNTFKYSRVNGKNYGITVVNANASYNLPMALRSDWLQNLGASIPTTLQEFEDLYIRFRNEDPDRNGKKDTYAITGSTDWGLMCFMMPYFGAFGTNGDMWFERDGKLVYSFTEPAYKDALKLLNKWYKLGIIDPEFITQKGRTSANDDITYKFASGKIGEMCFNWFDDYQFDNGGNVSAKWTANHPEWKKYFDENKDKEDEFKYANVTQIPEPGSMPMPVYINVKPPVGPGGKSGTVRPGIISGKFIMFGSEVKQDKMEKMLQIYEKLATDEEISLTAANGPEGKNWIRNAKGQRVYNPDWKNNAEYDPEGRKLGIGWWSNQFQQSNPKFLYSVGGDRKIQRYERCAEIIGKGYPGLENMLKAPLPSQNKYPTLTNGELVKEYVFKAILGKVDIDATFDAEVKKWMDNGGEVLTKEANEWFNSLK